MMQVLDSSQQIATFELKSNSDMHEIMSDSTLSGVKSIQLM